MVPFDGYKVTLVHTKETNTRTRDVVSFLMDRQGRTYLFILYLFLGKVVFEVVEFIHFDGCCCSILSLASCFRQLM